MADPVQIASFPNEMEAQYWASVLENEGIRSMITPLMGGYGVFGHVAVTWHGLYVLPDAQEQARQLLPAESLTDA